VEPLRPLDFPCRPLHLLPLSTGPESSATGAGEEVLPDCSGGMVR
jgi:hypothetical protein